MHASSKMYVAKPEDETYAVELVDYAGSRNKSRTKTTLIGEKRVTGKHFENSTLARFKKYEKQKNARLLDQKKERLKRELVDYTNIPKINSNKRPTGSPKNRDSLLSRLDQIIETRKANQEKTVEEYRNQKDEAQRKHCTFTPNINKSGPQRTITDLFEWENNKKRKMIDRSLDNRENIQQYDFKPKISKKSKQIIEEKMKYDKEESCLKVEDRLMRYLQKKNKNLEQLKMEAEKEQDSIIMSSRSKRSNSVSRLAGRKTPRRGSMMKNCSKSPMSSRGNRAFELRMQRLQQKKEEEKQREDLEKEKMQGKFRKGKGMLKMQRSKSRIRNGQKKRKEISKRSNKLNGYIVEQEIQLDGESDEVFMSKDSSFEEEYDSESTQRHRADEFETLKEDQNSKRQIKSRSKRGSVRRFDSISRGVPGKEDDLKEDSMSVEAVDLFVHKSNSRPTKQSQQQKQYKSKKLSRKDSKSKFQSGSTGLSRASLQNSSSNSDFEVDPQVMSLLIMDERETENIPPNLSFAKSKKSNLEKTKKGRKSVISSENYQPYKPLVPFPNDPSQILASKRKLNMKYTNLAQTKNIKQDIEQSITSNFGTTAMLTNLRKVNKKLQNMQSIKSPFTIDKDGRLGQDNTSRSTAGTSTENQFLKNSDITTGDNHTPTFESGDPVSSGLTNPFIINCQKLSAIDAEGILTEH